MEITEVVGALIFRGDEFLICQRPAHKARGLLWEFVGGKVEKGESKQAALIRECREELGVEIQPRGEFASTVHRYPDITVRLTVFTAEITAGEIQLLEHEAVKWILPKQIKYFTFCPADKPVLKRILKVYGGDGRHNKDLGAKGEKKAARYLKRRGYKILYRNYKTPFCEVDIVAKRGDVVSFCEVKTRNGRSFARASEAVDDVRKNRYIRAAKYFMAGKQIDFVLRFDVIEVYPDCINFIPNAYLGN